MERIILHCDMDNFFASVECRLNPDIRQKRVAVCGNTAERHGIVLAKNQKAKLCGVKTGDPIWKAKLCCPDLLVVPPHYDEYLKYSRLAKEIYYRFTDKVEPFGMDECWLDVTGSVRIFGSGEKMAAMIRRMVKKELGLTVSVGVSFNKIFAKLGSDLKKPDSVTVISAEHFKQQIWPLPVESLLGVGKSTRNKLDVLGIHTIGQLAQTPVRYLKYKLGVNGVMLWQYANGLDDSRVMQIDEAVPIKSIGHGVTTVEDLQTEKQVWPVILALSQEIGEKLRKNHLAACGVQVFVRGKNLQTSEYQKALSYPLQNSLLIAKQAYQLFRSRYPWNQPVRAVSVRAISLKPDMAPRQLDFFFDAEKLDKLEKIDQAVDNVCTRFGKTAVSRAALLGDLKMPTGRSEVLLPSGIGRKI